MSVNKATGVEGGAKLIQQVYLHGNGPALRFALHSAVEVGAAAVAMARLVWAERMGQDTAEDA